MFLLIQDKPGVKNIFFWGGEIMNFALKSICIFLNMLFTTDWLSTEKSQIDRIEILTEQID